MPRTKASIGEVLNSENVSTPGLRNTVGQINDHNGGTHAHEDRDGEHGHEHGQLEQFDLIRIALTAIAAGFVWFACGNRFRI